MNEFMEKIAEEAFNDEMDKIAATRLKKILSVGGDRADRLVAKIKKSGVVDAKVDANNATGAGIPTGSPAVRNSAINRAGSREPGLTKERLGYNRRFGEAHYI